MTRINREECNFFFNPEEGLAVGFVEEALAEVEGRAELRERPRVVRELPEGAAQVRVRRRSQPLLHVRTFFRAEWAFLNSEFF